MEEIHNGMDPQIKDVNDKILGNMAINYAVEEKKNVLIYFYTDGLVSLHFKALSTFSILQDNFAFLSISDPSQQVLDSFQVKSVPGIAGVLAAK